jgi:serine/threonine protein kinase
MLSPARAQVRGPMGEKVTRSFTSENIAPRSVLVKQAAAAGERSSRVCGTEHVLCCGMVLEGGELNLLVSPVQPCVACGAPTTSTQKFCNQCGARLVKRGASATTIELTLGAHGSLAQLDGRRFPPGAIVAQRYRMITLLGRGGMGEVYRADDLLLGQQVALKFLDRAATASESALSRFRNEVRIARQVSHPNVCRVYDIGEVDGLAYLTMEYIDGEDLASLLRRIGKLPEEKALEIARQLCAGLAAAHEQGIVHRDLKPGNLMLDGKGRVRITDFGLANLVERAHDIRSGTPAYMAPEQRKGQEVTAKSDLYALGIVLHELFTGKRPSRETRTTGLGPAVERAILRCLEEDARMRPPSALSVAAALPGGDPLAAALAVGETPSPEVVADAFNIEARSLRFAVTCLSAIIAGLALFYYMQHRGTVVTQIPMRNSPEVLAAQARAIANSLGYSERPVDTVFGWEYNTNHLRYISRLEDRSAQLAQLRTNRPPSIHFWYRESSRYLYHPGGHFVTRAQPSPTEPGMLEVVVDPEGRLIEFRAQPPAKTSSPAAEPQPDWNRLFAAAALDPARLTPVQPILTPPVAADVRLAWTGPYETSTQTSLKAEAASWQGYPVFWRILWLWIDLEREASPPPAGVPLPILIVFITVLPIGAGLLVRRHIRLGRGDRRGSFRLASLAFISLLVVSLARQHHIPTIFEGWLWYTALRDALVGGFIFWVFYMAFEPYVRARSPAMIISWSRLLAGRFRDPLVGADILRGLLMGVISLCIVRPLVSPWNASLAPQLLATTGAWISIWCWFALIYSVGGALTWLFLLTSLHLLVRLQWLAVLICVCLGSVLIASPGAVLSAIAFCAHRLLSDEIRPPQHSSAALCERDRGHFSPSDDPVSVVLQRRCACRREYSGARCLRIPHNPWGPATQAQRTMTSWRKDALAIDEVLSVSGGADRNILPPPHALWSSHSCA